MRASALLAILCVAACQAPLQEQENEQIGALHDDLTEAETTAVLNLVNQASLVELDDDVGLDRRAAENIVAHRDGADGVLGTADDNPFDTLGELDAIPYVGASALSKLAAYAGAASAPTDAEILAVANTASQETLDDEIGLDRRAAENIVAHRDGADGVLGTADDDLFDTIAELDAIPYVGESALAKIAAYAAANAPADQGCLIISEYIEGWGNFNKAVELFNCGSTPIELSSYAICLVRNDDDTCTVTGALSGGSLAPGDVHTTCRKATGTFNDPMVLIRDNCDQELPGVMTFSGDDRLVVFRDGNGDGALGAADDVMDAFGLIAQRPASEYWKNKVLRRCNLAPFDGATGSDYFYWDYFTSHTSGAAHDFGVPPVAGCP